MAPAIKLSHVLQIEGLFSMAPAIKLSHVFTG